MGYRVATVTPSSGEPQKKEATEHAIVYSDRAVRHAGKEAGGAAAGAAARASGRAHARVPTLDYRSD
ncbi:hypothetical protein EVAR_95741_1 [Eumeta japonica]|uniref:Uncharacterized protein n=1 Tax=Eumeta variegata TaxID=151549 RepID=A0A4C1UKK3_EUMVA|nr:hypothetical protein EVAR_95741_1 [Eumeta japonica]